MGSQLDHIHSIKVSELGVGRVSFSLPISREQRQASRDEDTVLDRICSSLSEGVPPQSSTHDAAMGKARLDARIGDARIGDACIGDARIRDAGHVKEASPAPVAASGSRSRVQVRWPMASPWSSPSPVVRGSEPAAAHGGAATRRLGEAPSSSSSSGTAEAASKCDGHSAAERCGSEWRKHQSQGVWGAVHLSITALGM